ncbi:EAL domain-containing protein [Dechloromonas sp.]|uniref:EAL domain-containing protein n=1 Tax=Dechloromonas sp. TaxID=1917218 RepID=UPI00216EA127|nr:EAL domain-containing protein [Dechloromonas sp.]MBU3698268.1 EAL domain-containing protein [Dechloromonas sp.]
MTTVAQLMTLHADSISPDAALADAAALMVRTKIPSVIVLDGDRLAGILTERDLLHAMHRHESLYRPVREFMTSPVRTMRSDTDIREAYRTAARLGIRHIVVTNDTDQMLGVISETDFRRHFGLDHYRQVNTVDGLMERVFPRLPPNARLAAAVEAMESSRASCVVVIEDGCAQGIVTERDVVRLYLGNTGDPTLAEVMTSPLRSIHPETPVAAAAALMLEQRIRHLTVVDGEQRLVGLLSEHSLLRPFELDLVDEVISEQRTLASSHDEALERICRDERYQRTLLDAFPFLVWLKDTESRFLAVNQAFADAAGQAGPAALIGRTDLDFFPQHMAEAYRSDDAAVMHDQCSKTVVEQVVVHQRPVWHETYKAPVTDASGRLLGTVGFARDISELKKAEEALLIRNAALAALLRGERLENALELIALSAECEVPDLKCAILLAEPGATHLRIGAAPSLSDNARLMLDGMPIADDTGASGTAAFRRSEAFIDNVFEEAAGQPFHAFARDADVVSGWAEALLAPDGELLGTFSGYRKLPGRLPREHREIIRQAGQLAALIIAYHRRTTEIQASQTTFRGIFDAVSDAIFILDGRGHFLDANRAGEQLSGYSHTQLVDRTHERIAAEGLNDLDVVRDEIAAALNGQARAIEFWGVRSDGQILLVRGQLSRTDYFGQPAVLALVSDITAQRAEQQRLEIERDLAAALAAGTERQPLLATMLDIALRFPEFDAGGIYWRQADGSYRLLAQRGLSDAFVCRVESFAADSVQAQWVRAGETVCCCTQEGDHCGPDDLLSAPHIADQGFRCLIVQPIIVAGQPLACLNLAGYRSRQISGATHQSIRNLATHCAQALLRLDAQEQARHLQQNLAGLFDALNDFIFIVDLQGRIVHHNHAVTQQLGYAPEALIGQPVAAVHPENMHEMVTEVIADMVAGRRRTCPLPIQRADGSQLMVETRFVMGHWDGQPAIFGVSQGISERLHAEARQRLAASVFDNAHEGIMITDPKGIIVEVNNTFTELTGYSHSEAVGHNADLLKSGHHDAAFYQDMWQTIREVGHWRGEVWNRKKSGEIFVELLTISTVRDRLGEITQYVAIFSDITLLKEHQQRLEQLAHFDALTQLPNRMLLADRLQLAMAQTQRNQQMLAVFYLDLDGFKPVNDTYGHAAGDRLLIEVAQRLKQCVRAGDTVSRLGGDEFVLLIRNITDIHECDRAASRVLNALAQPFAVNSENVTISASIGVTVFPNDGSDADALLRHADQAMYAAKQAGRNRFHLFDPESDRLARVRRDELGRIRDGLIAGEFTLHYQPKVNMREGRVLGAEALIRWQHPECGLLMPAQFLPVIEGSELDIDIGNWVLEQALRQLEVWREAGHALSVSVNVSGPQLQAPGFVDGLARLLHLHPAVPPHCLEIEILETAALDDMAGAAEIFAAVRRLGITLALDDFGTGYSSLTYFRRLPADTLKIDQSFVRDMLDDPEDLAIVEGVIGLTRAFNRHVVAEGVETPEHGLILLQLGCDIAQGYGIARPMPGSALSNWIYNFVPNELWNSIASFNWSRDDLPMLIAEIDHRRWLHQLEDFIATNDREATPPTQDHHRSRFGRWFYGPAGRRYASMESYAEIETIHLDVHRLGNELIDLKHAGDTQMLAKRLGELHAASERLIEMIQVIQAEVLLNPR